MHLLLQIKLLKKNYLLDKQKILLKFLEKKHKLNYSKDPNIKNLEKSISEKIGINVSIKNNKKIKEQLHFLIKDTDQLNKIIDIIKIIIKTLFDCSKIKLFIFELI